MTMMPNCKTEQAELWAGEFGDKHTVWNRGMGMVAANLAVFGKILGRAQSARSAIEFGANVGLNLRGAVCGGSGHRTFGDRNQPQDVITWFLMGKTAK